MRLHRIFRRALTVRKYHEMKVNKQDMEKLGIGKLQWTKSVPESPVSFFLTQMKDCLGMRKFQLFLSSNDCLLRNLFSGRTNACFSYGNGVICAKITHTPELVIKLLLMATLQLTK